MARSPGGETDVPALQRSLGFWQVTATGVGIVIGAGIYVLIGAAAREAGAALWMSFAFAAVLSALTALSYAELAGMYPSAGAEYAFARHAFNEFAAFIVGWLMVAANIIAAAAVSIGFAQYLRHFVDVDQRLAAIVLLLVLTALIISGLRRSTWLTLGLVALQVAGLVLVIAAGLPHVGERSLTEGGSASGVFAGAALVFFAFIGFDEIVTLSEETRDAARVIPRALLAALAISTGLYLLVSISAVSLAGAPALAGSSEPLALAMEGVWGNRSSDVISFIAMAATMNAALLMLTAASRLTYGMARGGSLPAIFGSVGTRGSAPYVAALGALAVAVPFAAAGDIAFVASVTDFAVYAIFIAVNAALIVLRLRQPAIPRPFSSPWSVGRVPILPILGIVTAVLMLAYIEASAWAGGVLVLAAGTVAWLVLSRSRGVTATA